MKVKIITEDECGKHSERIDTHDIHVGHLMDMTGDVAQLLSMLPAIDLQRLRIEMMESAKNNKSYLNLLKYFPKDNTVKVSPLPEVRCPICGEISQVEEPNTKNLNDPENYYAAATLENGNLAEYYDEIIPFGCINSHVFYVSRDSLIEVERCH